MWRLSFEAADPSLHALVDIETSVTPTKLTEDNIELLREADALANAITADPMVFKKISQMPVILFVSFVHFCSEMCSPVTHRLLFPSPRSPATLAKPANVAFASGPLSPTTS